MRRILTSFLILLMLTPSLACAMPVCMGKGTPEMAKTQPCADHHATHEKKAPVGKVNLLKDCMGVDFMSADNAPLLKKLELQKDFHFVAVIQTDLRQGWVLADAKNIRGPPPDWPGLHQTQPPILLTTQRFLI